MNLIERTTLSVLGWVLLCGGCSACAHSSPPRALPAGSIRTEPPVASPPRLEKRSRSVPLVWLTIDQGMEERINRGWPLLVDATVQHPDASLAKRESRPVSPIRIIPPAGKSWDTLLQLKLYSPDRTELVLPLKQVSQPDGPLVLDADSAEYTLRWHLGPEETRGLAPGTYSGFARLQSAEGAQSGGWTGVADSLPATCELLDEPVPMNEELVEEKAITFAQYHLYRGDRNSALATLEEQLARQPQSVGALAFKGEMLEAAGELQQAYRLYNAALEAHFLKHPNAQHPPFGLMERSAALGRKLFPETFQ